MTGNSSLSDYLFELRRNAPAARLQLAIGGGAILVVAGLLLGPHFAALTGLGCAVAGICTWALVNQAADMMNSRFSAESSSSARWLRIAGIAALGVAAIGALLFMYSFVGPLIVTNH